MGWLNSFIIFVIGNQNCTLLRFDTTQTNVVMIIMCGNIMCKDLGGTIYPLNGY